jgi:hypothetical protein
MAAARITPKAHEQQIADELAHRISKAVTGATRTTPSP